MDVRRFGFLAACSLLVAAAAFAQPYPGYFYPSGIQAGQKIRVVVGGVGMGGVRGAHVTGGGVKVTRIVPVPAFPRATGKTQLKWVDDWLEEIIYENKRKHRELPPEANDEKSDWAECTWYPFLDELQDLELQVLVRDRCTPLRYPQPTPALDQILLLDMEAAPDAEPGMRNIILYDRSSASAPHPFVVTAEPHVQEKFFVIPPIEQFRRRRVPEVLHLPTEVPPQDLPCYLDGQVWPGEVDEWKVNLKKGQNVVFALTGRELLPYLGDAVPGFFNPEIRLYDPSGKRVAGADDFYYLPDPVMTYAVPEDGTYKIEVCDNLYRGRSDFVYYVHCFATPDDRPVFTPQQRAFECFAPAAPHDVPDATGGRIVKKGTIDCPGRVDRHFFEVKEPGIWKFELFARRQGSPVDGVIKLYGPMGDLPVSSAPLLATWDDVLGQLYALKNVGDDEHPIWKRQMLYVGGVPQVECDPIGTWKILEPGKYCVTVADRVGLGGENYDYALAIEPMKPSFEVYAENSAFVADGDKVATFRIHLLRLNGYKGLVALDSTDQWDVFGEFEDEKQIETEARVENKGDAWEGVKHVTITATGVAPDGERTTVRVTPCDSVEQAFAYTHFLPQPTFYFCAPAATNVMEEWAHPLPHLLGALKGKAKVKTSHANGQSCTSCHGDKTKKTKKHPNVKNCVSCHKNKA